jgi:hypothetical protein
VLAIGASTIYPASQDPLLWYGRRGIEHRQDLAAWLNDQTPEEYTIADFQVGATAYYAQDRAILDLLGLNDVTIAHTDVPDSMITIPGHEKYNIDYVLEDVQPEIIVVGQVHTYRLPDREIEDRLRAPSLLQAHNALFQDDRLWRRYSVRAVELKEDRWYFFLQRNDTVRDLRMANVR